MIGRNIGIVDHINEMVNPMRKLVEDNFGTYSVRYDFAWGKSSIYLQVSQKIRFGINDKIKIDFIDSLKLWYQ